MKLIGIVMIISACSFLGFIAAQKYDGMLVHGDRLFFCSDGITQAGLGSDGYPFGQGLEAVVAW